MGLTDQHDSKLLQLFARLVSWWRDGGRLLILGSTATVLASVMLGFMAVTLPWWFVLMLVIGVISSLLMFLYPLIGLSMVVLTAFQGLPGILLRELPLGSFRLQPYEFCFFVTLAGSLYKLWREKLAGRRMVYSPNFGLLTVAVVGIVLGSVIYSRWGLNNVELAFAEPRPFLAILILPVLPIILNDDKKIVILERVLVASGVLVSVYVLIQLLAGFQVMSGRMEDLELSKNSGVTRTVVGVSVFVQAYAIYVLSMRVGGVGRWWLICAVLLVLTVMGVLGTYTRGSWISIFAGGMVVAYIRSRALGVVAYLMVSVVMIFVALGAIYVVDPLSADAMIGRALGIHSELTTGASFGWRVKENELAYKAIAEHPYLGVGIGGAYKDVLSSAGSFLNEQYMIHNAYIYFPLKMGVPGLVLLCLLVGAYVVHAFGVLKKMRSESIERVGGLVAGVGTVVAFFITGIEGQTFNKFAGLLIYCLILWLTARFAVKLTVRHSK